MDSYHFAEIKMLSFSAGMAIGATGMKYKSLKLTTVKLSNRQEIIIILDGTVECMNVQS